MNKNVIFLLLMAASAAFIMSCETNAGATNSDTETAVDSLYPSRPRILLESSTGTLPLCLHWESVNGAQTYEIETADSPLFNSSLRNWTLRDTSFEISALSQPVLYLRIRSRFDSGTSRWSETLEVKKEDDTISLGWVR